MAQRVQVLLVCDLHEDEVEGVETVAFGLDGSIYEIDVCEEHGEQLRDSFAPFVGAARRAGRPGRGAASAGPGRRPARSAGRSTGAAPERRGDVSDIREWARQNGHAVNDRGRIAASVLQAYEAAH